MPSSNSPSFLPTKFSDTNLASAEGSIFSAQVNDSILIICISFAIVTILLLLALFIHLLIQRRYKNMDAIIKNSNSSKSKQPVIKSWTKQSDGTFSITLTNVHKPNCIDDSLILKMSYKINIRGDLAGSIGTREKRNDPSMFRGNDTDISQEIEDILLQLDEVPNESIIVTNNKDYSEKEQAIFFARQNQQLT